MISYIFACAFLVGVLSYDECVYPGPISGQTDYYWRNYFGVVPYDAVPGGYSEAGNVTYVAQLPIWTHPGTFVGNIYPGRKEATASLGRKVVEGTYVKILCGPNRFRFQWKATTGDTMHLLTEYHWVIGGAQGGMLTYIGRASYEGEVQIGRAFPASSGVKGLWLYNKQEKEITLQSFELLVLPRN